ncbi:MAG: glycerophosphodiester phosphodiesterase, partial [Spirochaetota bacterium]
LEIKTFPTYPHLTHDLKTVAEAVIDVVREYHMEEYVTIISFDWNVLSLVREIAPEIEIGCIASTRSRFRGGRTNLRLFEQGASPWLSGLDADDYPTIPDLVHAFGAPKLYLNYRDLKPSDLVRSRELGLELVVWTVNSTIRMNQFAQWGVDGIITDRPDLLRDVLERRKEK